MAATLQTMPAGGRTRVSVKKNHPGAEARSPRRIVLLAACLALLFPSFAGAQENGLPRFFVYLQDVDPSILQDIRYFGDHNFLGRPVKGYRAPQCILTVRAAKALARVQARLLPKDLSLKVYDCYRPVRAVQDFVDWAQLAGDELTKGEFYPTIDKSLLFKRGYIARRSAHSRGSAVDLAIVPLPVRAEPEFSIGGPMAACHLPKDRRFADNSLDFGTGYDCFHELSHTNNPAIAGDARDNRNLLVSEMARAGFKNYHREWWHFGLVDEPYRKQQFDFPITMPGVAN